MEKVILGLSGGVDSSVAAKLLLDQGYHVEALYMRNWDSAANQDVSGNPEVNDPICSQERDYQDALAVANHLGIVLHRHDFIEEYWNDVFEHFLDEYRKGRTPNPDILCNKYIKFKAFLDVALSLGAQKIAMGHYAQVKQENGEYVLLRGKDKNKDQTYFLSQLTQEQLSYSLFPIGHLEKSQVRNMALDALLPTAKKKDSTGVCFIGERDFGLFLSNYLPAKAGPIITEEGHVLGEHQGLMNYTIGQRKGLGIGGSTTFGNEPWFVVGKNLEHNQLIVGQGFHHPLLYSNRCFVEDINWIPTHPEAQIKELTAKFRYRQQDVPVRIEIIDATHRMVYYPEGVRAVTPGQACVFYDGDVCLGGGTIAKVYQDDVLRQY